MKIVGLGGSLRPHSFTYQILQLALKKVQAHHVSTELLDLRKLQLPFCNGECSYPNYPDVEFFRHTMKSAAGILLATPEYHGSLSGVLKNALDLLDEEQMVGKVVGLIAVTGGTHSMNALNTMRLICRHLHCWVLPDQMIIPYAIESFDSQGELKDRIVEEKLDQMIAHLIKSARQLVQE